MRFMVGCALLVVAGCGLLSHTVSKIAVEYNLAVERAANEVLFLNIVRAKEERPLHFTSITTVRGTASTSANVGITIPFGGDAASIFPLTLGVSGTTGSSTIDVTVLDTKEFTQGILSPVSIETVEHFLVQDYESTFLAHLVLHDATSGDMRVETLKEDSPVGVPFTVTNGKDLAVIQLEARKIGLSVRGGTTKNSYQLVRTVTSKRLRLGEGEDSTTARLRSPEGIIYALGELMQRIETNPGDVELYDWEGEKLVLFYAIESKRHKEHLRDLGVEGEEPVLTCSYEGSTYVLPPYAHVKTDTGVVRYETSSMAVLAFLSQLIGLHKSSKDRPSTGVVTVAPG